MRRAGTTGSIISHSFRLLLPTIRELRILDCVEGDLLVARWLVHELDIRNLLLSPTFFNRLWHGLRQLSRIDA